jgi:hypothetical protein
MNLPHECGSFAGQKQNITISGLKVNPLPERIKKSLATAAERRRRNFVGKAHYCLTFHFRYVTSFTSGGPYEQKISGRRNSQTHLHKKI